MIRRLGGEFMRGARERLLNRREAETFDVAAGGLRFRATVGTFDDGRLAEVCVDSSKVGSAADAIVRDAGILVSLCLQHGCAAGTIARALSRNSDGTASSIVGAILDKIQGLNQS
jgi:hypothetical protein